ncbi:MAG: SMC-Scp complex subunit ScpB [Thermoanaerobacteraceae bacterium]|nr:SMC-Scp complex subunit ScpB [Thermoanaerobacteraceae bacterium]
MDENIIPLIEGILFLSGQPINEKELSNMLNLTVVEVKTALDKLIDIYSEDAHGIQIRKLSNGYCMCTKPELGKTLKQFFTNENKLSDAALETLAIIAYNQPVTKIKIDEIRGINSEKTIQTLLEREFIREAGRLESPGKPILYETTDNFLKYFGMNSLKDLPNIE